MPMKLSFPIWEKLGGREEALAVIEARLGKEIERARVYRWIWLRKLPGNIASICMDEAIQRGLPASLDDCRIVGIPHAPMAVAGWEDIELEDK